jgi:hypothetical protein
MGSMAGSGRMTSEPTPPKEEGSGLKDAGPGLVDQATKLLAVVAALGGLIYVLGGGVLALRLWRSNAPFLVGVVSQLPREVVISTALTVLAPAGAIATLFATGIVGARAISQTIHLVTGSKTKRDGDAGIDARVADPEEVRRARLLPPRTDAPEPDAPRPEDSPSGLDAEDAGLATSVLIVVAVVLVAVISITLASIPLISSRYAELRSSHWIPYSFFFGLWSVMGLWLAGLVIELVVLAIAAAAFRSVQSSHRGDPWGFRVVATGTLLVASGLLPASILASAAIGFPDAKICPASGGTPELGELIGETSDRVYLLERTDAGDPRVASFPMSNVGELFAGPEADRANCDSVGVDNPATP